MNQDPDKRLAAPFHHYKFRPEKWEIHDTLAVSTDILGSFSAFTTQRTNLDLYKHLYTKFPDSCEDVFEQFMWVDDSLAPTTKMDHAQSTQDIQQTGPKGCGRGDNIINGLQLGANELSMNHIVPPQNEPRRASMSWSVGANRAIGFKSIFMSGPQPGWNSPSVYYPIGLHGGDFDVVGWSAACSFVVRMGASRHFSWSSTSGLSAQTDTYQEILSKDGKSYFHNGAWLPVETRAIVVKVKGDADVPAVVRSTVHGPIVSTEKNSNLAFTEKPFGLAMKYHR